MFALVSPRRISATGLFFALLALTAQLAFGAIVPRPEVALVLQGSSVICHAPPPPGTPAQPGHHHTSPDALLCPLASALATPGVILLASGPALPPPRLLAFRRPGLPPPTTAPPAPTLLAAQPRGPPALV